MLLEVGLIGVHHTIKPWQKLLSAVVGVQHNGNAVQRSDRANVVSGRDGTTNGSLLRAVLDTLPQC
jgi:hypothetical protein